MKPRILFIGSIGAVAETSEIQRQAYNQALKENGIDWNWSVDTYKRLLKSNGGQDRLEMLAEATGQGLSEAQIKNVHSLKTSLAGEEIIKRNVRPRPGLVELIKEAKDDGVKVAWVTTTGHENTDAILAAFKGVLSKSDFDHIFHRNDAKKGKPSSDIYHVAMEHFNADPADCIAIEDSLNSFLAAKRAEIFTIVTLGDYHDEAVENIADLVVDSLDLVDWSSLKEIFKNAKVRSSAV